MEDRLEVAAERARAAYAPPGDWNERIRAALHALLDLFDQEPNAGRALVVEALCAGPQVLARRRRVLRTLAEALEEGRGAGGREGGDGREAAGRDGWAPGGGDAGLSPLTAEGLVGAALAVVYDRFAFEASPRLRPLLNQLMCMIVYPYLGPAAARMELQRPLDAGTDGLVAAPADSLHELPMRFTYRTMRVLLAIAQRPGCSNREIADASGAGDQGQISKLLSRLRRLGLIENTAIPGAKGTRNAWALTASGRTVERRIAARIGRRGE
jgi:DNA-binding MarR family transcriptional regulator